MFMLSGAIILVGKQTQLNANALSLWEGQGLIVQAITKQYTEARAPGCPHSHLPALPLFRFHNQDGPLQEERLQITNKCVERNLGILIRCHTMTEGRYHNVAGTAHRCDETHGLHQPQHLHLHQIAGLRVTEVQCQLPCQCHQGLIDLAAPGICTIADTTGSQEAI